MKNILLTLSLFSFLHGVSQPNFVWAKAFTNSNGGAIGWDVEVDNSGNVYSIGQFNGGVDFDPGTGSSFLNALGSWNDIYISKLNASGTYQWAKRIGGTDNDFGYGIALDGNANVYVCGTFSGTVDFDPGSGTTNLVSPGTSTDIFVAKFDASGNFLWAKNMGGATGDIGYQVAVDASGNVYTTGYFYGTSDFDPGSGTYTLTSAGSADIFISKLTTAGVFVWAVGIGSTSSDIGYGIATDPSGNVLVTGSFNGTVDFDPSTATVSLISNTGSTDIFAAKFDANGNYLWAKGWGSSSNGETGMSVCVDASANVLTTGYFSGSADFDPGSGTTNLNSSGNRDIFVSKLDPSGNFVWAKAMGGSSIDEGYEVSVDGRGNVYTTGSFDGTADFDPGSALYNMNTPTVSFAFTNDIFVSKLDSSGNFVWARDIGGTETEYGYGLYVDQTNAIFGTGKFGGGSDFDPTTGTYSMTPANFQSSYVFKWCQAPDKPLAILGNTLICAGSTNTFTVPVLPSATSYSWGLPGGWSGVGSTNTIVVTAGSVSGNLSVTAVNACGTSTVQTLPILLNPLPFIIVSSGSICTGSSFTMNPSGASTYTFSNGSPVVTPTTSTTYSITGTSAAGCISASPAIVNLAVHAIPAISVNSGTICLGNTFTMVPSGASTYTFSNGSAVVNPSTNSSYSVSGTSSAGCVSTVVAVSNVTVLNLPLPVITVASGSVCAGSVFTIVPSGASTYSITGGSFTVSPTSNSTYSVIGTSMAGCTSTSAAVATVTVNALPVISVNQGTICAGSIFTLQPFGANSYSITGGSATVSPAVTTNYSVFGTDANGCNSASPAISTVVVNPLPNVSITSERDIICIGESVQLSAGGAISFSWSSGKTGSLVTETPVASTGYTVLGIDANGCGNSSVFTQSVSACDLISERSFDQGVNLFPNPSKGSFVIRFERLSGEKTVEVRDQLGRVVFSETLEHNEVEVSLPGVARGIYFIYVQAGKTTVTKKLVID